MSIRSSGEARASATTQWRSGPWRSVADDFREVNDALARLWPSEEFEAMAGNDWPKTTLSVRHRDYAADVSRGQEQVVAKACEIARVCGFEVDPAAVMHSGGWASVRIDLPIAELATRLRGKLPASG